MNCPKCQSKALKVKRLEVAGYDPNLLEHICSNPFCNLVFYATRQRTEQEIAAVNASPTSQDLFEMTQASF